MSSTLVSGRTFRSTTFRSSFASRLEYQTPRPHKGMSIIGNPVVSYVLGGWGVGAYAQYQSAPLLGRPAAGLCSRSATGWDAAPAALS